MDRVSPETSPLSTEQQELRQEPQASDGGKGMVVVVEETMDDGGKGMVVVVEETMDDAGCGSEIQQEFQEEKGLVLVEKRVEQQQQASPPLPSSVQQQAPGVPLPRQQQQLPGMVPPSPWPPPLWQGSELGALVARSVSFGMGWFGVWGDGREHVEEEGKREPDWKREGIGVVDNGGETWKTRGRAGTRGSPGILVVGWGVEPLGRRLTKPRRERVREKFKIINCLTAGASCSNQACIRCDVFSLVSSTLLLGCACWFCW